MAKTENVFVRVEPQVKEQAEVILKSLCLSMSDAVGMFLQQIVLQRGIPFEVKLPRKRPIFWDELTEEERNELISKSIKDYEEGRVVTFDEVQKMMKEAYGV